MKDSVSKYDLLLRYLDGQLNAEESVRVSDLLRTDRDARKVLRELSEQVVMVGEIERTQQERLDQSRSGKRVAAGFSHPSRFSGFPLLWTMRPGIRLSFAILLALILIPLFLIRPFGKPEIARVTAVFGPNQMIGSDGGVIDGLDVGYVLREGDTVATLSHDAMVVMDLSDETEISLTGRSTLRILNKAGGGNRFQLVNGHLWGAATNLKKEQSLKIRTPTSEIEFYRSRFDVEAGVVSTLLWVDRGSLNVVRLADGAKTEIRHNEKMVVGLDTKQPLSIISRHDPVYRWSCRMLKTPNEVFGRWVSPHNKRMARLHAKPILIYRPNKKPGIIYAASLPVFYEEACPVTLLSESVIRIQGRLESAVPLHIGIATKKLNGGFSGKFEYRVSPEALNLHDYSWDIEVPIKKFLSRQPDVYHLSYGRELAHIYVYTVNENVGLEINRVDLIPPISMP